MVNRKQKQEPAPRFETSPERVAMIEEVLNAMHDAGGHTVLDAFTDEESTRRLAERLRLPYLQVELMVTGHVGLTQADVDDYNGWRAALNRKAGAR